MTYYRSGCHTVYDCRYHLVRITKYRKKWLSKEMQEVLTHLLYEICEELFVKIIRVGMEEDHVHMYLSITLTTGHIPEVIQKLKGKTSKYLSERYASEIKKYYRKEGLGIRAAGYFICTVGEVNDKLIIQYVEEQGKNPPSADKSPGL